jgi:hypothetical protein
MVKKISYIAAVIIAGALCFYFFFTESSDSDKIKKQFRRFSQNASKTQGEGTSSMLLKSHGLEGLFDEKCYLETGNSFLDGDYTPQEISSKAVMARKRFKSVLLVFHDLKINIEKDNAASAVFTVTVDGTLSSGDRVSEAREMQAGLAQKDGVWLFNSFKLVNVLRK